MASSAPLRIGYVPEHFSTPLHYATEYFGLAASLVPFPSGTGAMITALRAHELDVGIGLTEGWIAGLGTQASGASAGGYALVGTYVETPLCWAVSTGAERAGLASIASLRGARLGVSRIGSGSYVMGYVLADQEGWLDGGGAAAPPFGAVVPLQTFAGLREAVNAGSADFFMWEHFTSKRYFVGEQAPAAAQHLIRRVGEIYTPWPSWHVVSVDADDERLAGIFEAINWGVQYFETHPEENVQYISTALDYTSEDAREWLKTVKFASDIKGVRRSVVRDTVKVLRKAGVLVGDEDEAQGMVGIERAE